MNPGLSDFKSPCTPRHYFSLGASEIGRDRCGTPDGGMVNEWKEWNLVGKERGYGLWELYENKTQEDMASGPSYGINEQDFGDVI